MQEFTGYEYLQMDVAANTPEGGDKWVYEERLQWAADNASRLEAHAVGKVWKERPLYLKAVKALRKAEAGEPTGHMVGFDAVCSGMQIMSVVTGCYAGAKATGLIDQNRRPDAYTDVTTVMSHLLGTVINAARQKVKDATMKGLYGSRAEPKAIFGEDTKELEMFYTALKRIAPGACGLVSTLFNSWQSWHLTQEWVLPDGGYVRNRVMQKVKKRIEVNELNHTTFTYIYEENIGEDKGLKNIANVIHSLDAYILRGVIRRCSYDEERTPELHAVITEELLMRTDRDLPDYDPDNISDDVQRYMAHYKRSGVVDPVILPYLCETSIRCLPTEYLRKLNRILTTMLAHKAFPIITVHDEFKCHPNNMNHLRAHYRDILAELAEENLMKDILSQIYGKEVSFVKLTNDLGQHIRDANYALC